jgi:hypothetical protein
MQQDRISELIKDLSSPASTVRYNALQGLGEMGPAAAAAAAPALIAALELAWDKVEVMSRATEPAREEMEEDVPLGFMENLSVWGILAGALLVLISLLDFAVRYLFGR